MKVEGYTYQEVNSRLVAIGCREASHRLISVTAKRERWEKTKIGSSYIYDIDDVEVWLEAKLRTRLQNELGARAPGPGQGMFRNDLYDFDCPECGEFAVPKFPKTAEEGVLWLDRKINLPWLCKNGHGETGT